MSIADHPQINQIAQQDGLAISLIRPRKDHPTPQRPSITLPSEVPTSNASVDVEMDGLTQGIAKMDSSLAFVPRGIRKKQVTNGPSQVNTSEQD
jgi:hypothetical protein